jgi:hypothetical protein
MGAEEVAAPCRHDDQTGDAQLAQFGIVAEKGSRPGAESSERQGHRAHELGRFSVLRNMILGDGGSGENVFLPFMPKDCIGTPITFECQAKSHRGVPSVG